MAVNRFLITADRDRLLRDLRSAPVNYDTDGAFTPEHGWRIDDFCQPLPGEAPGAPADGGPFEVACTLLRRYRVADPGIVRATYDPDAPLEGRNMLLEMRMLAVRIYCGVRVGEVVDEERQCDGRPLRVWGWPYRTLEGHIEQGEMSWEIWKWLDTGEVQFRIHSHSRMAGFDNPVIALGFWLFGRRERMRYLRGACRRMARLTAEATSRRAPQAGPTHRAALPSR